jgi:hypothetical protein
LDRQLLEMFDVVSCIDAANSGRLDDWVHGYLRSGPWANAALSEGLRRHHRHWIGPLMLPLQRLVRCCGPEPEMEFRVPAQAWRRKVSGIASSLADPTSVPPLIVEWRSDPQHPRRQSPARGHATGRVEHVLARHLVQQRRRPRGRENGRGFGEANLAEIILPAKAIPSDLQPHLRGPSLGWERGRCARSPPVTLRPATNPRSGPADRRRPRESHAMPRGGNGRCPRGGAQHRRR